MRTRPWILLMALLICLMEIPSTVKVKAQPCHRIRFRRVVQPTIQYCPNVVHVPTSCESHPIILCPVHTGTHIVPKKLRSGVQELALQGDGDESTWREPGETVQDAEGDDIMVRVRMDESYNSEMNSVVHKVHIKIYSDLTTLPRTPHGVAGVVSLPGSSCTGFGSGTLEAIFTGDDAVDGVPKNQDVRLVAWIEYHKDLGETKETIYALDSAIFTMSP